MPESLERKEQDELELLNEESGKRFFTQGGGKVVWDESNKRYVFVEAPESFPDLHVGDFMPNEWGIGAEEVIHEIPTDVPDGILAEKLDKVIKEAVKNAEQENPLGKSRIGITKKLYKNSADAKKARKLAKKMRKLNRRK